MFCKIHGARALIYNAGKLLILKRAEVDNDDPGLWEIPGGGLEEEETPEACIKREIFEETGLSSSVYAIDGVQGFVQNPDKLGMVVYICSIIGDATIRLSDEHIEHQWVTGSDLLTMSLAVDLKEIISGMRLYE